MVNKNLVITGRGTWIVPFLREVSIRKTWRTQECCSHLINTKGKAYIDYKKKVLQGKGVNTVLMEPSN